MDATVPAEASSAWVLEADPGPLRRAMRATRGLEPARTVALGEGAWCVQLGSDAPPPPRRVERRLGHPVELRMDCDVAASREGRGYYLLLVARPAVDDGLDAVLDAEGLAYREIVRTSILEEPARVCLPVPAVVDLDRLSLAITSAGLPLVAVYEVGACSR